MAESINKIFETKEIDETTQDTKITELQNKVIDLQQENTELASNMPWNTTKGESIHIEDSAKYSRNSLSICGNLRQETRSGKNLYIALPVGNNGGIAITRNEDGTYNLSGTATINVNHTAFIDIDKSKIKNNVAYTLSFTKNLTGLATRVEMYNGETWLRTLMSSTSATNNSCTGTANTTNATKARFGIFINSGTTVNIQNLGLQLEEGTVATEYEQYGAMPSTEYPSMPEACTGVQKIITCKKNMLDVQKDASVNDYGITVTTDNSGVITVNGTTNATAYIKLNDIFKVLSYSAILNEKKKFFKKGKYVISLKYISGVKSSNGATLNLRDKMQGPEITISSGQLNDTNATVKGELIKDFEMFTYIWIASGTTFTNYKFTVQIERINTLNENATEYEPYAENIEILDLKTTELCKIKDSNGNTVAQDRAVYKNNKWQWEKKIWKVVLNGTENWQLAGSKIGFFFCNSLGNTYALSNNIPVCSHFVGHVNIENATNNNLALGEVAFNSDSAYSRLYIYSTQFKTAEELKTFLAEQYSKGTPVTIYYVLRTPQYQDCIAEQSAVLDKIHNNFDLQKGTNNIIVESENGIGLELDLSYMQDKNLKDKKLEERITTLENLLSTTQTSALLLDNLQNDLESEVN